MHIPPSPHFTPLSLARVFNADRASLDGGLQPRTGDAPDWSLGQAFGERCFHGIPFTLGEPGQPGALVHGVGLLTSVTSAQHSKSKLQGPKRKEKR